METLTEAGSVFETDHRGCSALRHHRHGCSFATIVLSGVYVEVRDAVPEVCRSGSVVVHDAAEEHADRFADDTLCLNVEFPQEIGVPDPGIVALDNPLVRGAVEAVIRSFYSRSHELTAAVKHLQTILSNRRSETLPDRPRWLRRVIEEFAWAQPVPFREAATLAGVHETHFSRAFRRHVSMTANEYRARARIHLASKLLLTTTAPLARVALSAGFSDQSHLTRVFSRTLGLSPAGYRRTFAR